MRWRVRDGADVERADRLERAQAVADDPAFDDEPTFVEALAFDGDRTNRAAALETA